MKRLKVVSLCILPYLLLLSLLLYHDYLHYRKTAFPLEANEISMICFAHSPEYDGDYTLTDSKRIHEIIDEINKLERSDEGRLPSSEIFYTLRFYQSDGSLYTLKLDKENILITKVRHELYSTDCSIVCSLLEQTYAELKNGTVE